jgi:hypothetical protein
MAYSLRAIHEDFKCQLNELNQIVLELSVAPSNLNRDTHIEGCFIRLVVSWECFIEEYFLRCMCRAKTRSKYEIKPLGTPSKSIDAAFKKIHQNRGDRDKDFADWLDAKKLQQRINDNFRKNSRTQTICESPDKMYELRTIRNAIAHRSPSAIAKFENYVKNQLGYLAALNPTMASLLIQKKRNSNELIFTLLSSYFLALASRLTK